MKLPAARLFRVTTERTAIPGRESLAPRELTWNKTKYTKIPNALSVGDFVVKVIDEKEALASAIATAKAKTEINIDNSVAMNKKKQSFVHLLNGMARIKPGEKIVPGSDYKFNAEGNQVKYFYDVVEKTSIDFNRNDVRNLAKKYLQETDEISSKLDSIEINTKVVFTPSFDINDSFEDIVVKK